MNPDTYYDRPEISNSDLSNLELLFSTKEFQNDATEAYRFGSLLDAMVTENNRVNYFKRMLDEEQFSSEEFRLSEAMKRSFFRDPFCRMLSENSTGQVVFVKQGFGINYLGFDFELDIRIKYDFFMSAMGWGGDLKSTTAKTQDQFLSAIGYFKYWKQRALYMDISGADKDVLIGVSKFPPHRVFKVMIERGDRNYLIGKQQYQEQAFRWWTLFENFNL